VVATRRTRSLPAWRTDLFRVADRNAGRIAKLVRVPSFDCKPRKRSRSTSPRKAARPTSARSRSRWTRRPRAGDDVGGSADRRVRAALASRARHAVDLPGDAARALGGRRSVLGHRRGGRAVEHHHEQGARPPRLPARTEHHRAGSQPSSSRRSSIPGSRSRSPRPSCRSELRPVGANANAPETAAREWNAELSASWVAGTASVDTTSRSVRRAASCPSSRCSIADRSDGACAAPKRAPPIRATVASRAARCSPASSTATAAITSSSRPRPRPARRHGVAPRAARSCDARRGSGAIELPAQRAIATEGV